MEKVSLAEEFSVGVVGAGYVGLITAACLAHVGRRVVCVDRDEGRIAGLREGRVPFYEPGLEELVVEGDCRGRLSFSTDLLEVVRGADVLFVAVDTPQGEDGSADLSSVAEVARGVGRALAEEPQAGPKAGAGGGRMSPLAVVNKSTVPAGSGDYVSMLVREGAAEPVPKTLEARTTGWSQTPSSCARGAQSTIPCSPTGSCSGPTSATP